PWDDLTVPDGLDVTSITDDVMAATQTGGPLPRLGIVEAYRKLVTSAVVRLKADPTNDLGKADPTKEPDDGLGSNNWAIGSAMSPTGKPIVANDPHRGVTNPSLRYIVHLSAPGWNVIGGGQPPFVGVSIGHNEKVAWGLTIVGTDFQDVFVEELNPANLNEMRYDG